MTRAKDHLHLIVPQRFYAHQQRSNGDRHMYSLRTRFIPNAITDYFEAPVPIGARLKQMWH
jgi:DNA helicase-2/ATP-dependent DNA helicase PcrA